jgi:hypothetical protein
LNELATQSPSQWVSVMTTNFFDVTLFFAGSSALLYPYAGKAASKP